ncbi:MAG: GGDEF domain-containing protein [Oscillospiraceae bacterium]|nr:GGDEF domain-containing protein [Oscillospiraceae bacterium]
MKEFMNIGVVCAMAQKEPVKPFLASLVKYIKESGKYRLYIFHCFEDLYYKTKNDLGAASVFDVMNYDELDAVIIYPTSINDKSVVEKTAARCAAHNVPLISIDVETPGASRVFFGYGDAFSRIVEHVIKAHNCRRIKLVAGVRNNDFSQTRIDSCREVMARSGLTLEEKDIMYGDFWEMPTYQAMDEFFASGESLPDAFVCCNDSMAMAVCLKLGEKGYRVPGDVIVTGFDGIETEKYHSPRLCTAFMDTDKLGKEIVSMLDRICGDKNAARCETELQYTTRFSESCGCESKNMYEINHTLMDLIHNYSYTRSYEEHMDGTEDQIAANPTPDNFREVLHRRGMKGSALGVAKSFISLFDGEDIPEEKKECVYPQEMNLFVSIFDDNSGEGCDFDSREFLPDLSPVFGENNAAFILPIHFQDRAIGYLATPYVTYEQHTESIHSFSLMVNRCIETIRLHEHMLSLNSRLSFLFTHDQLTGIFNRYGFYDKFRSGRLRRAQDIFVVSADMNDMKYINDNFGHAAGDDALIITAKALAEAAEDDETVCSRFGGDEFVAARICRGDAVERGRSYRERFREALERLNSESGYPFKVVVSIGVYCAPLDGIDDVDSLIELADRLMYEDKAKYKRKPRS